MTATQSLKFGEGFTLEPASSEHKKLAEEWTAWDTDHARRVDPPFWLEQANDRDSYLCSDRQGPVLFFKMIIRVAGYGILLPPGPEHTRKMAELHMQFMPASTMADHERIRTALMKGCPWIETLLIGAGVEEIYFDSQSPGLVAFTTKRLGFNTQGDGQLRKRLEVSLVAKSEG
jgi:hypothetical protein